MSASETEAFLACTHFMRQWKPCFRKYALTSRAPTGFLTVKFIYHPSFMHGQDNETDKTPNESILIHMKAEFNYDRLFDLGVSMPDY